MVMMVNMVMRMAMTIIIFEARNVMSTFCTLNTFFANGPFCCSSLRRPLHSVGSYSKFPGDGT